MTGRFQLPPTASLPVGVKRRTASTGRVWRAGQTFLKGPIPWSWLQAAARQPGKALHVAVVLWFKAGLERRREVSLSLTGMREMNVSRSAAARGLAALESVGLVAVERHPGRRPRVRLLDGPAPTRTDPGAGAVA